MWASQWGSLRGIIQNQMVSFVKVKAQFEQDQTVCVSCPLTAIFFLNEGPMGQTGRGGTLSSLCEGPDFSKDVLHQPYFTVAIFSLVSFYSSPLFERVLSWIKKKEVNKAEGLTKTNIKKGLSVNRRECVCLRLEPQGWQPRTEAACSGIGHRKRSALPEWHLDCDRSDPETVSSPVLSEGSRGGPVTSTGTGTRASVRRGGLGVRNSRVEER